MARSLVVPDLRSQRIAWLRRRFAKHNRLVFLVAVLTLLVTAALWYLSYAALFLLILVLKSALFGLDAKPPDAVPALFIYSGGLLVLVTWLARRRFENELPKDDKSPWEIACDFLLAIPRATLAVWGNLSAWQRLDARELELAADLIECIANERRMPLHQVPLYIPEPRDRMRILLGLQLIDVLRVMQSDSIVWLSLSSSSQSEAGE